MLFGAPAVAVVPKLSEAAEKFAETARKLDLPETEPLADDIGSVEVFESPSMCTTVTAPFYMKMADNGRQLKLAIWEELDSESS